MSDWKNHLPPLDDVTPNAMEGGWEVWVEEQGGFWAANWLLRGQMEADFVLAEFPTVGLGRISEAQARARVLGEMWRHNGPELPLEPVERGTSGAAEP